MSARQTGKLRPTGELNQLNQCYWARAASWDHLYPATLTEVTFSLLQREKSKKISGIASQEVTGPTITSPGRGKDCQGHWWVEVTEG